MNVQEHMDRDKYIYELLQGHYKDSFRFGRPYSNTWEKWTLIAIGFFAVLLFLVLIFHRFYPSIYTTLSISLTFILATVSYISYSISFIWKNIRDLFSSTSTYFQPLMIRIEEDKKVVAELDQYSSSELERVRRRLEQTQSHQNAWVTYVLGASAKLGLVPAAFALYALYTKLLAHKIPENFDIIIIALIVGLSVGAAQSNWVMLRVNSMIFLIGEALEIKSGVET